LGINYFLCHVLMSNLYVKIYMNVKVIFISGASERVRKDESL